MFRACYKFEKRISGLQSHSPPPSRLPFFVTSNSDDNLLKNIELFDKLVLRFNGRVLFVKDVLGDEICCWSFYGEGRKIAEVCCTSIVYATEKKQTKVSISRWQTFWMYVNYSVHVIVCLGLTIWPVQNEALKKTMLYYAHFIFNETISV